MPASATMVSNVPEEFALLVAALAAITDARFARGKVHPLPGVLALVVLGLMADCRSLSAISRYGQLHVGATGLAAQSFCGDLAPAAASCLGWGGACSAARLHVPPPAPAHRRQGHW